MVRGLFEDLEQRIGCSGLQPPINAINDPHPFPTFKRASGGLFDDLPNGFNLDQALCPLALWHNDIRMQALSDPIRDRRRGKCTEGTVINKHDGNFQSHQFPPKPLGADEEEGMGKTVILHCQNDPLQDTTGSCTPSFLIQHAFGKERNLSAHVGHASTTADTRSKTSSSAPLASMTRILPVSD